MRISATTLEAFRYWRDYPMRKPEAELLATIRGEFVPTPRVLLGRAYGRILERPDWYRVPDGYACNGYRFEADTIDPALATIDRRGLFEVKATKRYGAHTVVAKADHALGADLTEFKTRIGRVDLDRYARSCQWQFELDVLAARSNTFRVFRLSQDPYALEAIEELPLYPYPRLADDCAALVEEFAAYVRRRDLEAYLPDLVHELAPRPFADEPTFEDAPTREARPRPARRVVLPGEQQTPGTRRRWASGAEWAEHVEELVAGRHCAKRYADLRAHLEALSEAFIATQGRADLEAIRAGLDNRDASYRPPRGSRGGTSYERVLVAVNNALARLEAPRTRERELRLPISATTIGPLLPVADLPAPTFTLRHSSAAAPRQASLF